ncbi:MAG: site-2 protease family protein [Alphaproteobacteria bacterium]|nr:site-2 protease family protein [Alphaproteobacteria bacterium]
MGDLDPQELKTSVGLFLATLACVFLTYGFTWSGGDPLADAEVAMDSAMFAGALMAILLAHELGHFIVARRHGFSLSLPYFIPFPAAFGTFGAIIRLRSLPDNRSALIEMGAAGPLAGALVAVVVMALGLPFTEPPPELTLAAPAEPPPAWVETVFGALDAVLSWGPLGRLMEHLSPPVPEGHLPVLIFNNPPVMDLLGQLMLGAPPGRFDTLHPLALAGWVGCLLTAINLIPIGQLDGGHILNGLRPRWAPRVSRVLLGVAIAAGLAWTGWAFWGVLLLVMGAWRALEVPEQPAPTRRSRWVALATLVAFALTFMPVPVEMDSMPVSPPSPEEPSP